MCQLPLKEMVKKAACFVFASFRGSTYEKSTPRLFTRCGHSGQPF